MPRKPGTCLRTRYPRQPVAIPGPTTEALAEYAKRYGMVMIVQLYERVQAGVCFYTAAVIDADGTYLG